MPHGHRLAVILTSVSTVLALLGCSSSDQHNEFACIEDEVVGWGDSLTWSAVKTDDGYEQADPTWLEVLSEDLSVDTMNFGEPSQGSAEIAVRQGGLKPTVTLDRNEIPAGTTDSSLITTITPGDGWTQNRNAGTMKMKGTLSGVRGTLEHTIQSGEESFAFIPDSPPEAAVPVPPQTPFVGNQGYRYRDCVQIIWAGTNNSRQDLAITRDIASMVSWIPEPKRYLIVGTISGTRNALAAAYGPRFVDLRSWLITEGLAAAGVAPTPDDTKAILANQMPPSLSGDGTHFTQAAYTAIGHHLASVIKAQS
ncbi:hypothetical protein [Mycolicibacterium pyrenivorans]|uniref:hypothetical protein n=1 Tax=Mycolicibacterium pyrenivorans TaxID=187102 RepID=UPI0021F27A6E|nr:hypothetical protein [Mycolicibacterium pyrenivorans]MCV7153933.1 hypothetical protein [Mycolicibacterium pyrenivorans]